MRIPVSPAHSPSTPPYTHHTEFTISNKRQAFFSTYSRLATQIITSLPLVTRSAPHILLTGSLRTRGALASAVRNGHASLVGMARPSVVMPSYPRFLLDERLKAEEVPSLYEPTLPKLGISKLAGGSVGTVWYCFEMLRIARRGHGGGGGYEPSWVPAVLRLVYCYLYSIYLYLFVWLWA